MDDIKMTLEEMISALDGAGGRLIVMAMQDPVIREAHDMIMNVSLSLGLVDELVYKEYEDIDEEDE